MTVAKKKPGKPGVKTTEFWLTLVAQLASLALSMAGKISPELGVSLIAGGAAAYGTQRTVAKKHGV